MSTSSGGAGMSTSSGGAGMSTPTASAPLISLREVTKRFGGLVAVDGVSFSVAPGEILGLIGPNGSGKTTLINLITGLIKSDGGRVMFENENLLALGAAAISRRGVGRTFQLVRVLPHMTVEENICVASFYGPHYRGWDESKRLTDELMQRLKLTDKRTSYANQLTYVDQKRVELARALATRPKLLLLDEWLSGLNATELAEGIAPVRATREQGTAIILIEHVMSAIRALSDRVVVMNSGRVIAEGLPSAVLVDPQVVAAYIGTVDEDP
jgi:branched-chain amino acid transport system ATP-binding protein